MISILHYSSIFSFQNPWIKFPNIVLIITFNIASYSTIPYVELLYSSFFPTRVYCGPVDTPQDLWMLKNAAEFYGSSAYTTYTGTDRGRKGMPGSFNYECMRNVMGKSIIF